MKPEDQIKALAEMDGWVFWGTPHFNHDGKWHSEPYKDEDFWNKFDQKWAGMVEL